MIFLYLLLLISYLFGTKYLVGCIWCWRYHTLCVFMVTI